MRGDSIRIETDSSYLLIRQPFVSLTGNGTLKEFHALGSFKVPRRYDTIEFYGDNINFNGQLSFAMVYSDTFNIVHNFVLKGNFDTGRSIAPFNDLEIFASTVPIVLFFCTVLLLEKHLTSRYSKQKSENV